MDRTTIARLRRPALAWASLAVFGLCGAGVALAQEGDGAPDPAPAEAEGAPSAPGAETPAGADPTAIPEAWARLLGEPQQQPSAQPGAVAPPPQVVARSPAPPIVLRGRVLMPDRSPAAVLDVSGTMFVVREGASLTVLGRNGARNDVTVAEITAEHVVIDIEAMDESLTLR